MRERLPAPGGATYSDAVAVDGGGTRLVYLAGQTRRERDGSPVPTDLAGQTERCFDQIEALLARHGATLQDVVQITTYLTDLSRYSEYAAVRGACLRRRAARECGSWRGRAAWWGAGRDRCRSRSGLIDVSRPRLNCDGLGLGSVSEKVVRLAKCSVLVVR